MDEDKNNVVPMVRPSDAARVMGLVNSAVDEFLTQLGGLTGIFQVKGYRVTVEKISPPGR